MTTITIPDSVTSIRGSAFYNCTGLIEINWNAVSVSDFSSGSNVFYNAGTAGDGITVTFGDGVEKIPAYLFYVSSSSYRSNIKRVTFGNSVETIGSYAFSDCSGLTSIYYAGDVADWCGISGLDNIMLSGRVLYIGGNKVEGAVTIPDGVTSIPSYAFAYQTDITSVTIPDSVTSIGSSAFYNCSGLTDINWNAVSVSDFSSNNYVFYNAGTAGDGITVTFGDSVEKIPAYAFRDCSGLTTITIPDSVTSIRGSAFYNCTGLIEINWNAVSVSDFSSGSNVFYNAGTAGDGITVTFGDGVEKIPAYLFYVSSSSYRSNIKRVTFGNSVETIGSYAFAYCSGLTSVTIGNSVTSIGDYAFYSCSGLTSVTMGNGVKSIGSYAFAYCSGLTSVTIPDSVTSIGGSAFYNCTGLIEINWNAVSVSSFGSNVFYNAGTAGDGITVTFGDGVEKIPAYAFYGCNSLTSVTIPDSVTSIGGAAFYNCSGLTSVTIGNGVTSIGDYAFYGCKSLTSITIPDSVTSIRGSAFYNCTGLIEINWNAVSVSDFSSGSNVFYNAGTAGDGITVTFGDDVQRIPAYLFYVDSSSYRPNIKSVTIGNGVTSIEGYAFAWCTSLTSVAIPDSVTSIERYAFRSCSSLTSVTFEYTSNWYVTLDSTATSGTSLSSGSLANPSTAAAWLSSTYVDYYWERK